MYDPHHLHRHEEEKKKNHRKLADRIMTVVGIAASFTSLPQIIKIYETEDVAGISLVTYIMALGTVIAWLVYGAYIRNKPLVYTTSIAIIINAAVIVQILVYQ